MQRAVDVVADRLQPRDNAQWPLLEASLRDALAQELGGSIEKRLAINGWSKTLGGVDVYVPNGGPDRAGIGCETKISTIHEAFYDLLKLAALCQQGSLTTGFAVVAAKTHEWQAEMARGGAISQLSDLDRSPGTWSTIVLITHEGARWRQLISRTSVKPAWVPTRLATVAVPPTEMTAIPNHQIRIVGVRHASDERLDFDTRGTIVAPEWPVGADLSGSAP